MRLAPRQNTSAPSLPVLRFLRSQFEQVCFFTPSTKVTVCRSPSHRGAKVARGHTVPALPSVKRLLATSSRRQASVESFLLNLEFLNPYFERAIPRTSVHRSRSSLAPCRLAPDNTIYFRHASTDTQPLWRRPWVDRSRKGKPDFKSSNSLPLPSFLDDAASTNIGRRKAVKGANELRLRCTEFDENGNVTFMDGEFRKSELIAKYGLLPRDLRKIDSSLLPHILVRPSAILINLLHLRVLIKHNRVLVLDAYGTSDSYTQSQFIHDLQGKLGQHEASRQAGSLPYEFRALEAVLISVTSGLEGEFEVVSEPVHKVLKELEEDIDRDKLRLLLIYSKKLGTFERKARLVRDAIDDLLEADDDLVTMYLTERAQGKIREEDDHTEVEMLLESYHKVCDEIVQIAGNQVSNIRNTEEVVKAILDANRNSLMLLDLKFSIGTLGIGSGAFIASLYGMNLKNFLEESDFGFWGVTGGSAICAAVVCLYGLKKLRRVQRVTMWGEQGRRRREPWTDINSPLPGIPGDSRMERQRRLEMARIENSEGRTGGRKGSDAMGLEKKTEKEK